MSEESTCGIKNWIIFKKAKESEIMFLELKQDHLVNPGNNR